VLPVAAAASAGSGVPAGRRHPVRGGPGDLDRVRPQVAATLFGDRRPYSLPWQRMPHKHRPTVVPGHAEPAVPRRADVEFQHRPDQGAALLFAAALVASRFAAARFVAALRWAGRGPSPRHGFS